jgi:hypothetical protein
MACSSDRLFVMSLLSSPERHPVVGETGERRISVRRAEGRRLGQHQTPHAAEVEHTQFRSTTAAILSVHLGYQPCNVCLERL